jgi:hypothetical protein
MEGLGRIWEEEPLRRLTRLESGDLKYFKPDFEVLNIALKALYHILGGRA